MTKRLVCLVLALGFGWSTRAAAQSGDTVIYYHTDAIGSVRLITDANGGVLSRYEYLPFGETCVAACGGTSPADTRQFAGKERDQQTGFDYFGGRYYASQSGRFTTVDPAYIEAENLVDPQRWNRYVYARNNPLRYEDPDGRILDTILDVAFTAYDVFDLGRSIYRGQGVSGAQVGALAADVVGIFVPFATGGGAAIRAASKAGDVVEGGKAGVEVVQRAMSRAELKATQETGLLRGGREGTHHVSDAISSDPKRARQRLALEKTPEVRVTMEVPAESLSSANKISPGFGMPGGGTQRTATGPVPVRIKKIDDYGDSLR